MPAEYNKLGVSFQYPENWTLDEADALAGRESVTIYSPGGGFWSVSVHPRPTDPTQLAKAALEAMREDYSEIEVESTIQTLGGRELIGYDMSFWYLDLTSSAAVRCLSAESGTYVFFCQAEDREFDQNRLVFDAITTSFLRNLR